MSEEFFQQETSNFINEGGEILLFCINDVLYGIEIQYITEIIGIQPITIVPKVPSSIKGVINIRGKVVPVISLRNKFNLEEIPFDERTCIVVVQINDLSVGIIVDRMREVLTINPNEICNTPDYKNVNANDFIQCIIESNGEIKLLLNIQKLIME